MKWLQLVGNIKIDANVYQLPEVLKIEPFPKENLTLDFNCKETGNILCFMN